ncbi:hypothetical protein SLA2020_060960 [Shorea laevis]
MQGEPSGIGYGLKYQARCISDVKADTDHTCFINGTLSLKEENEVHLIWLSSDGTELICEGLFAHPNEIWDLVSCPFDERMFSTVFFTDNCYFSFFMFIFFVRSLTARNSNESYGAAIWQIPELYGQLNSPQLDRIASLDAHVGKIKCVLWWPSGRHDMLISIDEENIFLWSLDCSKKAAEVHSKESAATCESSIQFWDLRTIKKTNSIEHAHVHCANYDTKKKHILVTAEDESGICIWDLRMARVPVQELPGHTHWTWAVTCNPEHDGLILSAGTDSTVNLWLASTSSSDKLTSDSTVESPSQQLDPLLNSYSDYEDSVYGLAWSYRELWIFASLSYDGRLVVESIKPVLSKKWRINPTTGMR